MAITAALVLSAAANAHAGAGDDARVLTEQINGVGTSSPGNVAARTVGCEFGERAIGGGIRTLPVNSATPASYTAPFSNQGATFTGQIAGQWRSRARNLSALNRNFIAYAVCSASSDATVLSIDSSATPSNEGAGLFEGGGLALCPNGQRAIGGGVFVDEFGAPATNIQQSGPVDETGQPGNTVDGDVARGWLATVLTTASNAAVRVYALCSAVSLATVQTDSKEVTASTSDFGSAICPAGARALAGGVTTDGNASSAVNATAPGNSAGGPLGAGPPTVAQSWFTNISNGASTRTYNFSAVCEAPVTAPADPTTPTGPTTPTSPTAPSNAFAVGRLSRNREKGTGVLALTVPAPGTVILTSPKLRSQTIAAAAGEVAVPVKAARDAKRKLRRKGKLKASAEITFTPTGGTPGTQTARVKLLRE